MTKLAEHIEWMDKHVPMHGILRHGKEDFRQKMHAAALKDEKFAKRLTTAGSSIKELKNTLPEFEAKVKKMQEAVGARRTVYERLETIESHINKWKKETNSAPQGSSANPIPIRPEDILQGPPPLPARASQTSAPVIIADAYMDSLKQHGAKIERVNLFNEIKKRAAVFLFARKHLDNQDYHTIFHHYGQNVKQNSNVSPRRIGSDLHAKITEVIRMYDKSRLLDPRQNTHIVEFTLPILQDAGHSVVGIQYTTDSHDPYNRKINATLGIVLPNNLARQLVERLKTAPEKTLQKLYEHILPNEENQTKRLIPKPAIRETTLWHVTPEKRTRLQLDF